MVAYCEIEHVLGLLERDRDFQNAVARIAAGPLSTEDGCEAYRCYRLYNAALRTFTEDEALMQRISSETALRVGFFRTFGYRGQLDFSVMPSVALRDLPLLEIGRGVHLGYGVSLGSDDMPYDGVPHRLDPIDIGARSFFNQHSAIEAGVTTGADCCIGIRAVLERDCQIGDGVEVGDFACVGAAAIVGAGARVGHHAVVGPGAIVDAGMEVRDGGRVPAHHRLTAAGLFPRPHRRLAA